MSSPCGTTDDLSGVYGGCEEALMKDPNVSYKSCHDDAMCFS